MISSRELFSVHNVGLSFIRRTEVVFSFTLVSVASHRRPLHTGYLSFLPFYLH